MKLRLAAVFALLLAACSQQSASQQATPAPTPTNPIDFPVYSGASILATRDWKETVTADAAAGSNSVFKQGAGTYSGHEVIAQSSATPEQLQAWLRGLAKNPPAGYSVAASGSALDDVHVQARSVGLDFEAFQRNGDGKVRPLIVLVLDPKTLDAKAGPMLGMVSKYKMLPESLRDPVDKQMKDRTGFTVSEFLNPNSPVGAALNSLDQFRSSGDRGIILIDAQKQ